MRIEQYAYSTFYIKKGTEVINFFFQLSLLRVFFRLSLYQWKKFPSPALISYVGNGQKPKAHKWKQRFPIEWQICRQYSLATDAPLGSNDPAVHSKACEQRERRMEGVNRSRT